MKYAGIKLNDAANGNKICVSYWAQGCPHRCKNCHNPETWNPQGGMEFSQKAMDKILNGITANGVERNFSVLGGEPLADYNLEQTLAVVSSVREHFPNICIYLWTGYVLEDIINKSEVLSILEKIDVLIDGLFIEDLKDLNLKLRGSSNQRVIDVQQTLSTNNLVLWEVDK